MSEPAPAPAPTTPTTPTSDHALVTSGTVAPPVTPSSYGEYAALPVLLLIAILVGLGAMTTVRIITRVLNHLTTPAERRTTYECGEPPVGRAWFRFNNRFYRIAIVFLACDTLLALLLPILPRLGVQAAAGNGAIALTALLAVVGAIALIVAYATAKGDFVWDKTVAHTKAAARHGTTGQETPHV